MYYRRPMNRLACVGVEGMLKGMLPNRHVFMFRPNIFSKVLHFVFYVDIPITLLTIARYHTTMTQA